MRERRRNETPEEAKRRVTEFHRVRARSSAVEGIEQLLAKGKRKNMEEKCNLYMETMRRYGFHHSELQISNPGETEEKETIIPNNFIYNDGVSTSKCEPFASTIRQDGITQPQIKAEVIDPKEHNTRQSHQSLSSVSNVDTPMMNFDSWESGPVIVPQIKLEIIEPDENGGSEQNHLLNSPSSKNHMSSVKSHENEYILPTTQHETPCNENEESEQNHFLNSPISKNHRSSVKLHENEHILPTTMREIPYNPLMSVSSDLTSSTYSDSSSHNSETSVTSDSSEKNRFCTLHSASNAIPLRGKVAGKRYAESSYGKAKYSASNAVPIREKVQEKKCASNSCSDRVNSIPINYGNICLCRKKVNTIIIHSNHDNSGICRKKVNPSLCHSNQENNDDAIQNHQLHKTRFTYSAVLRKSTPTAKQRSSTILATGEYMTSSHMSTKKIKIENQFEFEEESYENPKTIISSWDNSKETLCS